MREIFRSWRKKVGVIAMLLACVFMAGWIRGFVVEDIYQPGTGLASVQHIFISSCDGFTYVKATHLDDTKMGWQPGWKYDSVRNHYDHNKNLGTIEWRWKAFGFDFCNSTQEAGCQHSHRLVPYWSIVVPLTVLSTFLMLHKPRQSTLKKSPEPHSPKLD